MLNIIIISLFITRFEPLQDLLEYIFTTLLKSDNKVVNFVYDNLYIILSCSKCFSFWLSLLLTLNIFTAMLISLCVIILNKLIP